MEILGTIARDRGGGQSPLLRDFTKNNPGKGHPKMEEDGGEGGDELFVKVLKKSHFLF